MINLFDASEHVLLSLEGLILIRKYGTRKEYIRVMDVIFSLLKTLVDKDFVLLILIPLRAWNSLMLCLAAQKFKKGNKSKELRTKVLKSKYFVV